jgi:AraC-like DNA-binding protein
MTRILAKPEFAPLRPFVREIITLHSDNLGDRYGSFKFFADGFPGIMFIQSENNAYLNVSERKLSSLFLYGQTVKPIEIGTTGSFSFIIFFLYPHVIKSLFGLDAHEITNSCLEFEYMPFRNVKDLVKKLEGNAYLEVKAEQIADYLLNVIITRSGNPDVAVMHATTGILQSKGEISLYTLQQELNITERTLQRRFLQNVGVTPQLFTRITKFNYTFSQLKQKKHSLLTDVAYDNGFSDQSHFNRTFKEFTGMTPGQYLLMFGNT